MSINQDDEYYLTLPSNVSGPNNSISSWTTTLPSTLQLHGQWECGLAEIIYTNSAYTIPDPLPFEIHYQNGKIEHYYVPEGNYDNPGKLVAVLSSVVGSRPRARKRRDVATTTTTGTTSTVQQIKDDGNLDEGFEADDDDLVKPIDKDGEKPNEGLEEDDNDLIKPIGSTPAQPPKDNKESVEGAQVPKPKPDDSAGSDGKPAQKENEASSTTVAPPAAKPKPETVTPSEVKPAQNIPKDPPAQPKQPKDDKKSKPQDKPAEAVTGTETRSRSLSSHYTFLIILRRWCRRDTNRLDKVIVIFFKTSFFRVFTIFANGFD